MMHMSEAQYTAICNEWMRRYIETPETFAREWQTVTHFLDEEERGEDHSYGKSCTLYTIFLFGELFPNEHIGVAP